MEIFKQSLNKDLLLLANVRACDPELEPRTHFVFYYAFSVFLFFSSSFLSF